MFLDGGPTYEGPGSLGKGVGWAYIANILGNSHERHTHTHKKKEKKDIPRTARVQTDARPELLSRGVEFCGLGLSF